MPSDITTPTPAAAIDRLTLATDTIQGTEASYPPIYCFADDAE
ncbi:MAG: hypothetical protein ACKN9D_06005 [Actinomycetales bacterium]